MSKRLQIDYTNIRTVEFGPETKLDGDVLYVNQEDLLNRIDTSMFATTEIILAHPGDDARIVGACDFTQPRVKADAPETSFPGIWGKLAPAGDGRTVALKGVVITELMPMKASTKSLMDMKGPLADRCMMARHNHIILDFRPVDGLTTIAYSTAQKQAALTLAVYLASLAINRTPDSTAVYEMTPLEPRPDGTKLPRVAYLTSQWSAYPTQQFFFYGQSGIGCLPMIIHPNDILDGALVYNYFQPNYYYQEEATIKELYARHGKDIEFVGIVMTVGKTETDAKEASCMVAADIAKNLLKADVTINTKAGAGHCQLEQQKFHIWSERMGMPAVTMMNGVSSEKPGDRLVISDPAVNAVIQTGDIVTMEFPRMENLIGFPEVPALMAYDLRGPFTITTGGNLQGSNTTQGGNYITEELDLPTEGWNRPTIA